MFLIRACVDISSSLLTIGVRLQQNSFIKALLDPSERGEPSSFETA